MKAYKYIGCNLEVTLDFMKEARKGKKEITRLTMLKNTDLGDVAYIMGFSKDGDQGKTLAQERSARYYKGKHVTKPVYFMELEDFTYFFA